MRALLVVDIQNDFAPGGALAVPDGDQVVPVANRLMKSKEYDLIVATQDWHPSDHMSFASQHLGKKPGDVIELDGLEQILWPDHCIQHSYGARFVKRLESDHIHRIFHKGTDRWIDSYSGFFDNGHRKSTGLAEYLREHSVDQVHIVGLATDYCVKFTALDAVALGFETTVIAEGVRGVELNPGDCEMALQQMRSEGVIIR